MNPSLSFHHPVVFLNNYFSYSFFPLLTLSNLDQYHCLINSFLAGFLRQRNRYLFNCFTEKSLQCKLTAHREGNFTVIVCYQKTATHLKEAKTPPYILRAWKLITYQDLCLSSAHEKARTGIKYHFKNPFTIRLPLP